MHMSYEKQLDYKWNKVRNCLERIGGIVDVADIMEPIYGMEKPYNFRNKMQVPVGLDKDGRVQIGNGRKDVLFGGGFECRRGRGVALALGGALAFLQKKRLQWVTTAAIIFSTKFCRRNKQ